MYLVHGLPSLIKTPVCSQMHTSCYWVCHTLVQENIAPNVLPPNHFLNEVSWISWEICFKVRPALPQIPQISLWWHTSIICGASNKMLTNFILLNWVFSTCQLVKTVTENAYCKQWLGSTLSFSFPKLWAVHYLWYEASLPDGRKMYATQLD